jgi:hypothetical protein
MSSRPRVVGYPRRVVIYAIRCPRCSAKANGIMRPEGTKGTYREVYVAHRLERIVCSSCGLIQEIGPGADDYELWYKTDFKGHTLWARNEEHVLGLIEWLSSGRSATGTPYEALPQWMVTDRAKVVANLRKLVAAG